MKKIFILILMSVSINYCLFSENEITVFNGGTHLLELSLYSTFFMGTTARSRSFGNTISSRLYDTHLIQLNPAGMAVAKKNMLSFDLVPGYSFDIGNLYSGLQDEVNNAVDDTIEKDESPNIKKNYPDLKTNIGQSGGINQFGLIVNNEKYGSFGFLWNKPFYLDMNFNGNALNFTVEDQAIKNEGTNDEYIELTILPLNMELFSNAQISMQQSNIAWGKTLNEKIAIGTSVNFASMSMESKLNANIGGFIRQYGGDTDINVAFDDPNTAYRNTMNDSIDIDFKGRFIGMVFSTSWQHSENWAFDMSISTPREKDLNGSLHIVQHTLGALKLDADDDEDTFDVELLKPAQIAYTNRTEYYSDKLKLSIPGSFAISATHQKGDRKFIFSYEKPIGELSLDYSCIRYRDGENRDTTGVFIAYADTTNLNYKVGIKPKHIFKIAFGWTHFALSAQITLADLIADNIKDSDGVQVKTSSIIIPGLAVGTGFNLNKNTLIDFNVIALPSPFLRTSVTWYF